MNQPVHQYGLATNITTSSLICTGPGNLQGMLVASNSSGTVKFWDNTSAATTVLINTYTFATGSSSINFYGARFITGLYATIAGTADVTIVWNPYVGG